MDILKRKLAPVSDEAWQEIDQRAKQVLKSVLSARKVVSVDGPKGWQYTVISEGRLNVDDTSDEIKTGVYKVKPLVEARMSFELNKWELDNIERGAKDLALDALEDAVKKIALFEENAVYNGYAAADITGLKDSAKINLKFGNSSEEIMESITSAVIKLKDAYVSAPFTLVVGEATFKKLNKLYDGQLLIDVVKQIIGGSVVYAEALEGALLLPYDHDDLELTIGQDFSIGYEAHDTKTVKFFITESFVFRVLDDSIIVKFE